MDNIKQLCSPVLLEQFSTGPIEQQTPDGEFVATFFTFCMNGQHYIAPKEAVKDIIQALLADLHEFASAEELGVVFIQNVADLSNAGVSVQ